MSKQDDQSIFSGERLKFSRGSADLINYNQQPINIVIKTPQA